MSPDRKVLTKTVLTCLLRAAEGMNSATASAVVQGDFNQTRQLFSFCHASCYFVGKKIGGSCVMVVLSALLCDTVVSV